MPRSAVNPSALYDAAQYGFVHATASQSKGLLHCSGQVGFDKDANLVGPGDLAAQAAQAFANITDVLSSQNLSPADVVMIRTYVVDYDVSKLEPVSNAIAAFFGDAEPSAQTLIGVQALALPDILIEVEVVAAFD